MENVLAPRKDDEGTYMNAVVGGFIIFPVLTVLCWFCRFNRVNQEGGLI